MVALKEQFAYKTATLRRGRFGFNQVVYQRSQSTPERVVLVGWDSERGVFIWSLTGTDAARHASTQAPGYSLVLHSIDPDRPPPWLGSPLRFTPEEMLKADAWPSLDGLAPHPKRKAILTAARKVQPELFG
jgi:hypothetical protein